MNFLDSILGNTKGKIKSYQSSFLKILDSAQNDFNKITESLVKSYFDKKTNKSAILELLDDSKCLDKALLLSSELEKKLKTIKINETELNYYMNNTNNNNVVLKNKKNISKQELCNTIVFKFIKQLNLVASILSQLNPNKNIAIRRLSLLYKLSDDSNSMHATLCRKEQNNLLSEFGLDRVLNIYMFYLIVNDKNIEEVIEEYNKINADFSSLISTKTNNVEIKTLQYDIKKAFNRYKERLLLTNKENNNTPNNTTEQNNNNDNNDNNDQGTNSDINKQINNRNDRNDEQINNLKTMIEQLREQINEQDNLLKDKESKLQESSKKLSLSDKKIEKQNTKIKKLIELFNVNKEKAEALVKYLLDLKSKNKEYNSYLDVEIMSLSRDIDRLIKKNKTHIRSANKNKLKGSKKILKGGNNEHNVFRTFLETIDVDGDNLSQRYFDLFKSSFTTHDSIKDICKGNVNNIIAIDFNSNDNTINKYIENYYKMIDLYKETIEKLQSILNNDLLVITYLDDEKKQIKTVKLKNRSDNELNELSKTIRRDIINFIKEIQKLYNESILLLSKHLLNKKI